MELKWLEDFLSLASTKNFSKAAEERHTTQSTLSRRIQALEDWLGVPLVDRSSYPVHLNRAGEQFHKDAIAVVRSLYRARAAARAHGLQAMAPLRFGAQHVLARYYLPRLLRKIEAQTALGGIHLKSDNLGNGITELATGQIDFLVCYYHPDLPEMIDRHRFPSVRVAYERSIPVSLPDKNGKPVFALPGSRERPLPYIGFSPDVPVGWHRPTQMASRDMELHLELLHESTMGEIIREMVLQGRGVAWLQTMIVGQDLEQGRLALAGGPQWIQTNEIRVFRTLGPGRSRLEQVWETLCNIAEYPAAPPWDSF